MGYDLSIGELDIDYSNAEEEYPYVRFTIKSERHRNAPAFGEPTDNTNERWPSYSAWHNFAEFTGLSDLFWGKDRDDALIAEHPGCCPLTRKHKREIDAAIKALQEKYPNAKAEYADSEETPEENGALCRLVWLKYWVDWALENCKRPAFYNS